MRHPSPAGRGCRISIAASATPSGKAAITNTVQFSSVASDGEPDRRKVDVECGHIGAWSPLGILAGVARLAGAAWMALRRRQLARR